MWTITRQINVRVRVFTVLHGLQYVTECEFFQLVHLVVRKVDESLTEVACPTQRN